MHLPAALVHVWYYSADAFTGHDVQKAARFSQIPAKGCPVPVRCRSPAAVLVPCITAAACDGGPCASALRGFGFISISSPSTSTSTPTLPTSAIHRHSSIYPMLRLHLWLQNQKQSISCQMLRAEAGSNSTLTLRPHSIVPHACMYAARFW